MMNSAADVDLWEVTLGKVFSSIEPNHREFLLRQRVFFNASAGARGRVNVSPKDGKSLRVLDENSVAYLDLTGSGNETAAHLRDNGRVTLMFCAFEGPPLILRLYGQGRVVRRESPEYESLLRTHFGSEEPPGARQMIVLAVERVQTSCGYNVPLYQYSGERDTLLRWAEKKGPDGLAEYRRKKNTRSIDGLPTGLLDGDTTEASANSVAR